jgi:hypothetical protein
VRCGAVLCCAMPRNPLSSALPFPGARGPHPAQALLPFVEVMVTLRCLAKAPPSMDGILAAKTAIISFVQHALINVKNLSGIVKYEFQLYQKEFTQLLASEAQLCFGFLSRDKGEGEGLRPPTGNVAARRSQEGDSSTVLAARSMLFGTILPVVEDIAGEQRGGRRCAPRARG